MIHSKSKINLLFHYETTPKKPSTYGSKREIPSLSIPVPDLSLINKNQKHETPRNISLPNLLLPNDETLIRNVSSGQLSLSIEGVGGTYFVKKRENFIAVFKPGDEEAGAPSNPKRNLTSPRKGIKPGEGYFREIAAYLIDHGHYAGVPFTQIYEMDMGGEKKIGSLQRYIPNIGNITDYGQSLFSVSDVHRIAQLDIRLFNVDRNDENLLVANENGVYHLIPIDHAYSLPDTLDDGPMFTWMNWKQSKAPMSDEMLEYIDKLDIEKDEKILRMLNFKEESIFIMKMSTMILKLGAKCGLNFFEIALILTRTMPKELSILEEMVKEAMGRGEIEHFWDNYMTLLSEKWLKQ